MNYAAIYSSLIQKVRNEKRKKGGAVYYERHHVVPKCKGGNDSEGNLVLLTAKEHFVAHHLLWKMYSCQQTYYAYFIMQYGKERQKEKRKLKLSAKSYSLARESCRLYMAKLGKAGGKASAISPHKHHEDITKHASLGGKSKSAKERQKLGNMMVDSGALKLASDKFVRKQAEKRQQLLESMGLDPQYKPSRGQSKELNIPFYYGEKCSAHPGLEGLRRTKDKSCSRCMRDKRLIP